MNTTYYVVDNNALLAIGRRRRTLPFFREYCQLTQDVEHEARFLSPSVPPASHPVTPSILRELSGVMGTLQPGDTDLVDLYGNKGMADPVMVATVLALTRREESSLFPDTWVIVTLDKALTRAATDHGLETMTPDDLAVVIDGAAQ